MKNKDPVLWLACRLQRILSPVAPRNGPDAPFLESLLAEQRTLERLWRMYRKALEHQWPAAATLMARKAQRQAAVVHYSSAPDLSLESALPVPTLAELLAELHQLHEEFERVEIAPREGTLSVIAEPITLEGVYLGAFALRLDLERLARRPGNSALDVVALDPCIPSCDESVTHPHVRDNRLCAGDATVPLARALAEGRLADAFHLVNAVLHTFNGGSAYVQLAHWEGIACGDCDRSCSEEELWGCEDCGQGYCDECIDHCSRCERMLCMGCLQRSGEDRSLCRHCVHAERSESAHSNSHSHPLPETLIDEPSSITGCDPETLGAASRQGGVAIHAEAGHEEPTDTLQASAA